MMDDKPKYYKVSDQQRVVYYDVDETLISYFPVEQELGKDVVVPITFSHNRVMVPVWPMKKNIDLMYELRACGYQIAVWSQSGSSHAERIVQLLGLENLVDIILPKPHLYVDDKPFENQAIPRVYKK